MLLRNWPQGCRNVELSGDEVRYCKAITCNSVGTEVKARPFLLGKKELGCGNCEQIAKLLDCVSWFGADDDRGERLDSRTGGGKLASIGERVLQRNPGRCTGIRNVDINWRRNEAPDRGWRFGQGEPFLDLNVIILQFCQHRVGPVPIRSISCLRSRAFVND